MGQHQKIGTLLNKAFEHHNQGRLGNAINAYTKVLKLDPNNIDALHNLGLALHHQGKTRAGVEKINRAVQAKPDVGVFHSNLAVLLNHLQDWQKAATAARRAIDLGSSNPGDFNSLGLALAAAGDASLAEDAYRKGLAIDPRNGDITFNLAKLLHQVGSASEAVNYFRIAYELDPDSVQVTFAYAESLLPDGEIGDAIRLFERVVEIDPRHVGALEQLGSLMVQRGEYEQAETVSRQLLEIDPLNIVALNNLCSSAAVLGQHEEAFETAKALVAAAPEMAASHVVMGQRLAARGEKKAAQSSYRNALNLEPENIYALYALSQIGGSALEMKDRESLEKIATDLTIEPAKRSSANFALAVVARADGEFSEEFEHLSVGNSEQRKHHAAIGYEFRAQDLNHDVGLLVAGQDQEFFTQRAGWGIEDEAPVFIVGMPRSGTTLIERICAAHPNVSGLGELHHISRLAQSITQEIPSGYPGALKDVDQHTIQKCAEDHLKSLKGMGDGAARLIDKAPSNLMFLGLIALMFPRAKIIYSCRDPRDTALSCFSKKFASSLLWATSLEDIGKYHVAVERVMTHWIDVLPLSMLPVQYEDLVADLEQGSRRLIKFLGLEWSADCLDFHQSRDVVQTASQWQVRQPIYNSSVGAWNR